MQAFVSNACFGKFARLILFYFILFFIHFSVEQDVLIVDSVPLTVTLWWLSNGISGTINEKFPWRPAVLTWRPRESTQNPPLCS